MKTRSKALLLSLCAVLLVAATIFGTMAYLTSSDKVENTFTVGNVKIKLDEAKVNTDGTPVEGVDRVHENSYKLLPGHTYTKDPTVTVEKGSESAYVRMKVTFNNAANIIALCTDPGFSVTSSPIRPSPRVAPRTNSPSMYSNATDRPSTFGSTL